MKRHLVVYRAVLFLFAVLAAFAVRAEDKPKVLKRGGIPYDTLWKEEDVRKYLNLPRLASVDGIVGLSMNDISGRLEAVQGLAGYQPVKNNNRPYKVSSNELPVITFELRGEELPSLQVRIYDYQSWNAMCDKLFKYITSTVELWNNIPDYYAREERGDAYTLTRKGRQSQKWHFALKKLYVITVDVVPLQENAKSEEKAVAEMDKVIRELVGAIEGKE
ncbi:MAG: hypothetical protein L6455_00015 [Kiritimatiellae bacterium]|nr:hypothetical protein [Kiritimatiellia bacterium]